eukprot:CAMPEP_0198225450 /NCGR_PEP_ID=MMETSP1445-20131203/101143_1 /TAXON_ID=36898 /ORGANISM="Pyramimonas sp., Strain CCMP2087" /LENGTH=56 /DNA_ID=CAMNT_0043904971 /DNA_START=108 /DNA_END=278 /DNA_ORIENTATION=-
MAVRLECAHLLLERVDQGPGLEQDLAVFHHRIDHHHLDAKMLQLAHFDLDFAVAGH